MLKPEKDEEQYCINMSCCPLCINIDRMVHCHNIIHKRTLCYTQTVYAGISERLVISTQQVSLDKELINEINIIKLLKKKRKIAILIFH